ncbi:phosphatidic acid phosphatase type 2/haloperoxidase [Blakeslea trispora]|nr:phosphatidic acid phosphatase type 2/haloperoxidase [Blakeslea trispora]
MKAQLLKILSFTREIVITSTFFTILYLRSLHVVYFTCCAILATLIAKVLKHLIKQPRPSTSVKKVSYGMPSSHSTAISFFTAYLQCVVWATPHFMTQIMMIVFHCFSLAVIWSRVRLGHHTAAQVMAGTALGIACALLSFWVYIKISI